MKDEGKHRTKFSLKHLKEIMGNDKWCLIPKENGGGGWCLKINP